MEEILIFLYFKKFLNDRNLSKYANFFHKDLYLTQANKNNMLFAYNYFDFERDEIFSFIDFECYSDGYEYFEECLRLTEDNYTKCKDDAWTEYVDCVDSCIY